MFYSRLPPSTNRFCIQAVQAVVAFFHKNPQAEAYFAIIDVEGNAKVFGAQQRRSMLKLVPSDSPGCCSSSEKTRQGRICLQCRFGGWQGHPCQPRARVAEIERPRRSYMGCSCHGSSWGKGGPPYVKPLDQSEMAVGWWQRRWRTGSWPQDRQSRGSPRDCA